ncbi:uncharacterized protein BJ212DRAFT_1300786 [Suillus subaureus]|uniref:Uncharacterized protein n=1 Tax=Suillus subaureus TaxID=48587 RepID=A0A9P7E7T7_9AGAM|nr:uncharacterized protein BJ212DRAFT_1300786 [Suillus subaureus]KAG1813902.1 hypothetical protein BJ212DRAFT_1300786 [Suillus subaureus]
MVVNITPKIKHVRPKLTVTQKANHRKKAVGLSNAIDEAWEAYQEEAAVISEKYKWSTKWTQLQLHNNRGLRLHQKPNAWNAFTSQKLNEVNQGISIEGFYIAVRGDVEHFHELKIFYTPKAQSFIKEISHLNPKHFALKFKSWVTGNFDTHADSTHHLSPTKLINLCCTNIQEGLNAIMRKCNLSKKIKMNYDNYKKKIIKMHSIALEGWTCGKVQNPGKICHCKDLVTLLDALVNEQCLWIQLTQEQVEQHIAGNRE